MNRMFCQGYSYQLDGISDIEGAYMDTTDTTNAEDDKNCEQNAFQKKLFSLIAHDLRNSFNTVKGFSELLLKNHRRYDEVKINHYLINIHTTVCNANTILESLLQWASIQTCGWNVVVKEAKVYDLINEVTSQLKTTAESKQIKLILQCSEDMKINTDEEAIKIVLRNLLSNAIKFSYKESSVFVKVQCDSNCIKFLVIDNGIGMTEKETECIFSTHINNPKTGTDKEKGAGIGLCICKELVEKLSGKLSVESQTNNGTTFSLCLPLHPKYFEEKQTPL